MSFNKAEFGDSRDIFLALGHEDKRVELPQQVLHDRQGHYV